jgi:hypothetical protein
MTEPSSSMTQTAVVSRCQSYCDARQPQERRGGFILFTAGRAADPQGPNRLFADLGA